jgi:hypothetical protein
MLQLTLNPATGKAEQHAMPAAIAVQFRPPGMQAHFHRYGEGERLIAPGAAIQAALAEHHHVKSFLLPLYVSLGETSDIALRARMLPIVTKALRQLD